MSLSAVVQIAGRLPPRFRDDVISYARSVQQSLPEIFLEAGVKDDPLPRDQLVFVAGVKKLHAICSRAYWILDTSLDALRQSRVDQVRIGSSEVGRGSPLWIDLQQMVTELDGYLVSKELTWIVSMNSYAEIAQVLNDERR